MTRPYGVDPVRLSARSGWKWALWVVVLALTLFTFWFLHSVSADVVTVGVVSATSGTVTAATVTGTTALVGGTVAGTTGTFTGAVSGTSGTFTGSLSAPRLLGTGSAPGLSACGGTPSIVGNDVAGKVTAGTGVITSCTLTFAVAYTNAPACYANNESAILLTRATTTASTLVIDALSAITSHVISYVCASR